MAYQVIARKWRPQTFSDLVGQQHVTDTLSNAIKNNRVAHSYIFSGARGVGKTTAARMLAKKLPQAHRSTSSKSMRPPIGASTKFASCARWSGTHLQPLAPKSSSST